MKMRKNRKPKEGTILFEKRKNYIKLLGKIKYLESKKMAYAYFPYRSLKSFKDKLVIIEIYPAKINGIKAEKYDNRCFRRGEGFIAGICFGFFIVGLFIAIILKNTTIFLASLPSLALCVGILNKINSDVFEKENEGEHC